MTERLSMNTLSSFKISRLLETSYFFGTLNGVLILAISTWLLTQWPSEEVNSYRPLLMPAAPNIEAMSNLDRATELADMAHALSGWHLFGVASPGTEIEAQPLVTATKSKPVTTIIEDSNLDLTLKGLLSYDNGRGFALIATADGLRLFTDKDQVLEGYTLDKVLLDHVLLRGQGRLLKLALPKQLLDLRSKQQRKLEPQVSDDHTSEPALSNPLSD